MNALLWCVLINGVGGLEYKTTGYRLNSPDIESRWGRDLPHPSKPALVSNQPPVQSIPGPFPEVKWPGHGVDHQPLLSPKVKRIVEMYVLLLILVFVAYSGVTLPLTLACVCFCSVKIEYVRDTRLLPPYI